MDIIAEIMQRKKTSNQDIQNVTNGLIQDIIRYDKLSKNKKFTSLTHPIIKKHCPTLAKTVNQYTLEYVILEKILPVFIDFTDRSIGTLDLMTLTKRETLLNKAYNITLDVLDGVSLRSQPENSLVIKEPIDAGYKLMIVVVNNHSIIIYMLTVHQSAEDEEDYFNAYVKPITVSIGDNHIRMTSYSHMGNNDYVFGTINGNPIRIRDHTLIVGNEQYTINVPALALETEDEIIATRLLQMYCQAKSDTTESMDDSNVNETVPCE